MCVDHVHAYFLAGSGIWERLSIEECGESSMNSRSSMLNWPTWICVDTDDVSVARQ